MPDFGLRAIEVHSSYAWDARWIAKVLDFASRTGLNALVLHRNDIVDQVVFPGFLFGVAPGTTRNIFERYSAAFRSIYRYTPTRRSGPPLRRDYLRWVVQAAGRLGIAVYLENKELSFPDVLLELHPELIKDGHGCPTDPFWWDFLRAKYAELLEDVPDIAGIITSAGTGESRISISSNRCTCETCRATTPQQWYGRLLGVIHDALAARGKTLVVRDFAFDRKNHAALAAGFERLPPDVILAIKNTPHDYYPTFPDNPLTAQVGGREKWIEFDAMGQYFGWGIGPATMLDDLRGRMTRARDAGASGIVLRTDWESLDGHTAFDTPNVVNLYAGAALSQDLATPDSAVYERWLADARAFAPGVRERERAAAVEADLAHLRAATGTSCGRRCSCRTASFPTAARSRSDTSRRSGSRRRRTASRTGTRPGRRLLRRPRINVARILAEKDAALELVRELRDQCARLDDGALAPEFLRDLRGRYEVFEEYVLGFRALVRLFAFVHLRKAGAAAEGAARGAALRRSPGRGRRRDRALRAQGPGGGPATCGGAAAESGQAALLPRRRGPAVGGMMEFRALELHGKSMWDHRRIEEALRVIREYGLNALVLHESDLMTDFIFPRSLFDPATPWKGAPVRRGENALHNNMAYLRDIVRRASKRGRAALGRGQGAHLSRRGPRAQARARPRRDGVPDRPVLGSTLSAPSTATW